MSAAVNLVAEKKHSQKKSMYNNDVKLWNAIALKILRI